MHIHLDAVGGVAGDMFIAAMLDAFPDLRDGVLAAIRAAGLPADVHVGFAEHQDHALTGLRFRVIEPRVAELMVAAHHHPHTPFADIRTHLQACALTPAVRTHAIEIFSVLAEAEAKVHGKTVDTVSFHELGEWDSIADIVGAAYLIDAVALIETGALIEPMALIDAVASTWSVSSLPLGRGKVKTAHGMLPVPTPATVLLLEGFEFTDDGLEGERVTPTGAAILRHLGCTQAASRRSRRLLRTGIGFGARTFPGISNVLRVLAFEEARESRGSDEVAQVQFEVDDQTPEDLAIALDKLRSHPSVLDVLQTPAFGKKGRMTMHIQLLADVADMDGVFDACFSETTTIGLRYQVMQRRKLARASTTVEAAGRQMRVKVAERPGRKTAKVEADDLLNVIGGRAERERLQREAEQVVLRKDCK
ncbi:MAG: LarC family nickel insertion protein [Betaproteobacteria bacterium]|nr:LarC family nickel insertion protein [Betaproteobacteria bacterium]